MINLSDYLNYLNDEVVKARKKADLQAVAMAKEYAKDEYLRFFTVPRFAMPKVKLDIPIKVNSLDSDIKYNFKLNEEMLVNDINDGITKVNLEKSLNIPLFNIQSLQGSVFIEEIKGLENNNGIFVKSIDESLASLDLENKTDIMLEISEFSVDIHDTTETNLAKQETIRIVKEAIKKQHIPVSTKINQIFIDPNTTKSDDKDKIFINMSVDLEEEGIRINSMIDENGNAIEEISFE